MKLSSWDKQLVLALPRECAASQSDQTINPSKNEVRNGGGAGCKSPLPHLTEGRGDAFLLDILFHRMSVTEMLREWYSGALTGSRRPSNSGDEPFVDPRPLPLVREFHVGEAGPAAHTASPA